MGGGTRPPKGLVVALLLVCWLTSTAAIYVGTCTQDSDCQDFAECDIDCSCKEGFTENSTTGECDVSAPCTTGMYCEEECAEVNGTDTCFCGQGKILSHYECHIKRTLYFRFDLNRTFTPGEESHLYTDISRHLTEQFDAVYLYLDEVTGATHQSASGGSRTVVIVKIMFTDFNDFDVHTVARSFEYYITNESAVVNVTNEYVAIHDVDVYDTLNDADNWRNELDFQVCYTLSNLCNGTTHSCQNLKGLSFTCVPDSEDYSSKYYIRGVVNRPYNESEVDQIVSAFVNLTNEFMDELDAYPEFPVDALGAWPTDSKDGTVVVTYMVVMLPYHYRDVFVEFFWSSEVEISVYGVMTTVDEFNLFGYGDYAVSNINSISISICYTDFGDCPPSINCIDHYNGTFTCEPVSDYSSIHNGSWRALLSAPFSNETAEDISMATAAEIQRILRDEMLQGPINVTVAGFGMENSSTFVVVDIGFSYNSHYSQGNFIYESFILKNQTVGVANGGMTYSEYEFRYVKFYQNREDALAGGQGEGIYSPCSGSEAFCAEDRRCRVTDFIPACDPYCFVGLYSDGENCQNCGLNMTTYNNGTTRQRYCIPKCPQNESYNIFSKECEPCPGDYFSPEGDPRCYACHDDMEGGELCNYWDEYQQEHWISGGAQDIRIKLTAVYHQPCQFPDFNETDVAQSNLSLYFGIWFKYRHDYSEQIRGLCLLDYDEDTYSYCENTLVEIESDICEPDPSCSSDCDSFATNMTITVYNTLPEHIVQSFRDRPTYAVSSVSSIMEALFDTSRAVPIQFTEDSEVRLNFTIREAPEIMSLPLEEALDRHLYVSTFNEHSGNSFWDYVRFKEEVARQLTLHHPDFLYIQSESSMSYGDYPWHLSVVFHYGVDDSKINSTAKVMLGIRDQGNSTRNMTRLVGPIAIHTVKDDTENIVDWCAVLEDMGKPLNCTLPQVCRNFQHLSKYEELVYCDSPDSFDLYFRWTIGKPYSPEEDDDLEEAMVYWVQHQFDYEAFSTNVSEVAVNETDKNLTSIILRVAFPTRITENDHITLSEFIYENYILGDVSIPFLNSTYFTLLGVELYDSRMDSLAGHDPIDLQLCQSDNQYCGSNTCIDTPYGPDCFVICGVDTYFNGSDCHQCPENTTTFTWGAESHLDCLCKYIS